jgi:ABC-type phosphate transport system substrate-binding protein
MKLSTATAALSLGLLLAGTANADIVVIANKANPAAKIMPDQLADVYLGRANDMTPLDQPRTANVHAEFIQKVCGKKETQYEAVWAKLEFSAKGTRPRVLASSQAVKQAVAADPKAIGYIDKADVDETVKVVYTLP